ITLHAAKIKAEPEFVAAYMNNEHYLVSADPLRNQVKRAWGILDKTGFLDANAKNINIDEHINTSIDEEALKEAKSEYGSENPSFYEKMEKFFNENDR
ncbi:MAG: ABC transporter substrate-binding protein, partial [Lachnospiraceae bacterium]|nr:ABC transporter substrate-binding protein [Lachnospiraceae bacterium]